MAKTERQESLMQRLLATVVWSLCLFAGGITLIASVVQAQVLPLAPTRESGQTVTPAFEGWYKNADGTFSLSFGYYNRNSREVIEVPLGPNNFFAGADSNSGQPTRFEPDRHWGVFAVNVPANFGNTRTVTWNLTFRGASYAIPGSLKTGWEIDALEVQIDGGSKPPMLKFEESGGVEARGPAGAFGKPLTAVVGTPLALDVWAFAEAPAGRGARGAAGAASTAGAAGAAGSTGGAATGGAATGGAATGAAASGAAAAGRGRAGGAGGGSNVALTWFKHQGPGDVAFNPASPRAANNKATSTATFSAPGQYILRVRAIVGAVAGAGHSQCCWTNGFLKVVVSR